MLATSKDFSKFMPVGFGQRLGVVRKLAKLSQAQLAEKLQVPVPVLVSWENNLSFHLLKAQHIDKLLIYLRRVRINCTEEWLLQGMTALPSRISPCRSHD